MTSLVDLGGVLGIFVDLADWSRKLFSNLAVSLSSLRVPLRFLSLDLAVVPEAREDASVWIRFLSSVDEAGDGL